MPSLLEEFMQKEKPAQKDESKPEGTKNPDGTTTLPNGVVLDKDGKPCRTCTSSAAWKSMMKSSSFTKKPTHAPSTPSSSQSESSTPSLPSSMSASSPPSVTENECPPDVEELGRSSWTLLHSISATYPERPTPAHQAKTNTFIQLFSQLYPCWHCASDFQEWIEKPENDPEASGALKSQDGLGRWMCQAHNEVNRKLGKKEFDCNFWKERWKDGWKDGRCD